MLRQLARLMQRVPAAGTRALAPAVYADPLNRHTIAAETGPEGVACVDDAARLVQLLADVWSVTHLQYIRDWMESTMEFVLYMQDEPGTFVNFIHDWDGDKNVQGLTSRSDFLGGATFWQARAMAAMSAACAVSNDVRVCNAFDACVDIAKNANEVNSDIRAVHADAVFGRLRIGEAPHLRSVMTDWIDEIASCRSGDLLLNYSSEPGMPHLWGHIQEGVLCEAASILGRSDLVGIASASAQLVHVKLIDQAFDDTSVIPYEVFSSIFCVDRLHSVTHDSMWRELGDHARQWFHGRNPYNVKVYDPATGRIHDGIDNGHMNQNSGAESNIVGAHALLDEAVHCARENADELQSILSKTLSV